MRLRHAGGKSVGISMIVGLPKLTKVCCGGWNESSWLHTFGMRLKGCPEVKRIHTDHAVRTHDDHGTEMPPTCNERRGERQSSCAIGSISRRRHDLTDLTLTEAERLKVNLERDKDMIGWDRGGGVVLTPSPQCTHKVVSTELGS